MTQVREYHTKEEILRRAKEIIGIPLKQVDRTNRLGTGKGAVGSIIEESWFGYHINGESQADFAEAGVELKATPYLRTGATIKAKERLVCNIINYMEEYKHSFRDSSFWKKCNTMLIMSYEHRMDVDKGDFTIDKAVLFSFPLADLAIIEHDWEIIISRIKNGEAHLISEGDTTYLGACTKGANASSVRQQPFSSIPAKQRAFCLKNAYMTYILQHYIFGCEEDEHIIKDVEALSNRSFEQYIIDTVSPFFGMTQQELMNKFGLSGNAKNMNELILARILGIQGRVSATEEFKKAGIVPKTIRVQKNGRIKENMSFPTFNFIELSNETWETSAFRQYLESTKFLFIIFQEDEDGNYRFSRLKFWTMPEDDYQEVYTVWKRTVDVLREGVLLIPTSRGITNNLPKQTENSVSHVRPHAKDSHDVLPLPDGRVMPKQCFWLNNSYIESQIGLR